MAFDILPDHSHIVMTILKRYFSKNTTVWIFGSRLTKARRKYSDLDLLINHQGKKLAAEQLIALKDDFDESDLPYKVDIVDWNDCAEWFKEAISNKKIFYCVP